MLSYIDTYHNADLCYLLSISFYIVFVLAYWICIHIYTFVNLYFHFCKVDIILPTTVKNSASVWSVVKPWYKTPHWLDVTFSRVFLIVADSLYSPVKVEPTFSYCHVLCSLVVRWDQCVFGWNGCENKSVNHHLRSSSPFLPYSPPSCSSFSRHCRGRWRSRAVFNSRSLALWAPLSQGPISRLNWTTDRQIQAAGLPLTTTVRMRSQQARQMTKK